MRDILPILIVGAIIGTFALLFLVAFFTAKRKKVLENRERNMPDSEIIRRLLAYAKPYRKHFVLGVFCNAAGQCVLGGVASDHRPHRRDRGGQL